MSTQPNIDGRFMPDVCRENFLPVPNELLRFIHLFSGNEIKFIVYLLGTRNLKDREYGSTSEISRNCGLSKNSVKRIGSSLAGKGIVYDIRKKAGIVYCLSFLRGVTHKKVIADIEKRIEEGNPKYFAGVRYLYKFENQSDFTYSTPLENLFSGGIRKKDGTDILSFDPEEISWFKELTGNQIKALLYLKYRSMISRTGFIRISYRGLAKKIGVSHKASMTVMQELQNKYGFIRSEKQGRNALYCFNYRNPAPPKKCTDFGSFSQKGVHPSTVQYIKREEKISETPVFLNSSYGKKQTADIISFISGSSSSNRPFEKKREIQKPAVKAAEPIDTALIEKEKERLSNILFSAEKRESLDTVIPAASVYSEKILSLQKEFTEKHSELQMSEIRRKLDDPFLLQLDMLRKGRGIDCNRGLN